jgi:hypothetical protein
VAISHWLDEAVEGAVSGDGVVDDSRGIEVAMVVDDSLDAQDAAVLVVHLEPVPLHPVLHPGARPAPLPLVQDLPREAAVELAAEEREHVFGAQAEGGVLQEPGVELAQGGAAREEDVGRELGLMRRPVVAVAGQLVTQEGIHPTGKPVEDGWPLQRRAAIGDSLHAPGILEPEKAFSRRRYRRPRLSICRASHSWPLT